MRGGVKSDSASFTQGGRVAPGDCSPGAPTDPDVRDYRIRLLGSAIRDTTSAAIRCRFVDTEPRISVRAVFLSNGSLIRHPLSSTGSPRMGFPCFTGTMGCSETLPPISPRFVAFAWRYHACDAAFRVRPFAAPATPHYTGGGPGVCYAGCPIPALNVETTGLPRFLGNPSASMPCSSTPAGSAGPGLYSPTDAAFRSRKGVGSRDDKFFRGSITRPAHSLSTLRSRDYSRTTQDSLPAVGQLCRAGLATRWVPLQGLASHHAPPCPGFAWRTATFLSGGA